MNYFKYQGINLKELTLEMHKRILETAKIAGVEPPPFEEEISRIRSVDTLDVFNPREQIYPDWLKHDLIKFSEVTRVFMERHKEAAQAADRALRD